MVTWKLHSPLQLLEKASLWFCVNDADWTLPRLRRSYPTRSKHCAPRGTALDFGPREKISHWVPPSHLCTMFIWGPPVSQGPWNLPHRHLALLPDGNRVTAHRKIKHLQGCTLRLTLHFGTEYILTFFYFPLGNSAEVQQSSRTLLCTVKAAESTPVHFRHFKICP